MHCRLPSARGFGRHASEAPRRETPCQVESGTVASRNATRPCQENSRRPLRGVARPKQPRHRGRCHACSRAWPQAGGILLRPGVGEGRNNVLRRGRCANPLCEAVHGRLGFSRVIEEQSEGQHHWGKERRVTRRAATPCHVRKMAVLYAYGDVVVRSGEWPILVPFILSENEFAHLPLRSGWDAWQN
ncbi:protein of unknown function [Candidatus Nitrospira inopinata]|uniref:Uncharacterized protein n=1 Tax=Candidatus Nitrospira inopinata TaxID=1715989 RepID=A0A0S4KU80_9BACT|nr:protein of unknown function [Candidatus Nitrospira inopinata]